MTGTLTLAEAVDAALADVYDPCSQSWQRPLSVVELGLVRSVEVGTGGCVTVVIVPTTLLCMAVSVIIGAVQAKVGAVAGVTKVDVTVDVETEWTAGMMTERGAAALAEYRRADRTRALPILPGLGGSSVGGVPCG